MILLAGGGDIAEKGIVPVVGGQSDHTDVTNYAAVLATMQFYKPDVVIYTAGVSTPDTVKDAGPLTWAGELNVNLLGAFHVAKAALEVSTETLIFLASVSGLHGKPNHSGYCAAKAGVISLVQSLAFEGHLAYGISPGRVNTKMREKDYPGEDTRTRLKPTQIGDVVLDILAGKYQPGDNVVIRKKGFDTFTAIDRGEPWRDELRVGLPSLV